MTNFKFVPKPGDIISYGTGLLLYDSQDREYTVTKESKGIVVQCFKSQFESQDQSGWHIVLHEDGGLYDFDESYFRLGLVQLVQE